MRVRRPLAALCTLAPLVLAATACSDSSAGPITGTRGGVFTQTIANPSQQGDHCHRFSTGGVDQVTNGTRIDIRLFSGTNCSNPPGTPSDYLATTLSLTAAAPTVWRSFSTVGWPPPVPAS